MSSGYRLEGDGVFAREANGAEHRVAVLGADGCVRMSRGRGHLRKEVEGFLKDELPGLRRSGPSENVAAVHDRRTPAACAASGDVDGAGVEIEGCGLLPRVSDGHRPPLHFHAPPCPVEDPRAGDKTPEVVAWFFRYRPEEAELRYRGRKFTMPEG